MISWGPVSCNILCQVSCGKTITRYSIVSETEIIGGENKGSYHTYKKLCFFPMTEKVKRSLFKK